MTLEQRAADSSAGLETSIAALEKRDREISEKLNSSFRSIDTQLEGVSLQASTVKSMQDGTHNVVAKQQKDMEGMKLDIESYVVNAMANIASSVQANQGPADQQGQALRGGEGKGGRLNDPKKCEVDSLTDVMSKAAFCLWRDNLDRYLEEFPDFGMGANIFLKRVRLHPAGD